MHATPAGNSPACSRRLVFPRMQQGSLLLTFNISFLKRRRFSRRSWPHCRSRQPNQRMGPTHTRLVIPSSASNALVDAVDRSPVGQKLKVIAGFDKEPDTPD